ncbi:MAG: acyl-CoA thioester hydrolase/BAAT C-terminal domain-containing protein [Pseudomonadota bacterium]
MIRTSWIGLLSLFSSLAAGACAVSGTAAQTGDIAPTNPPGIEFMDISIPGGPIGKMCEPLSPDPSPEAFPALVFIGGSAGGLSFAEPAARLACAEGYTALALAYWGYDGLPGALEEIPLEYFDQSIEWLAEQPGVRPGAIGLVGYSRGGEGALLVASRNQALAAVVALVPGAHVGPNINFRDFFNPRSAWSLGGAPIPYATTRPARPGENWQDVMKDLPPPSPAQARTDFESLLALPSAAAAEIPVHDIGVPILMVGAGQDDVWASSAMVSFMADALDRKAFPHEVQAMYYGGSGHGFMLDSLNKAEGDAEGQRAWQATFSFLGRHLGPGATAAQASPEDTIP